MATCRLLVFKICGDGDYGALSFEQSNTTLEQCYAQMIEDGADAIEDEDECWQVELAAEYPMPSKKQAEVAISAMQTVTEIVGDYDNQKSTNWAYMVVEDN